MSRTGWESGLIVEHEDAEVLSWRNEHLATRKELELMGAQREPSSLAQEIDTFVGDQLKSTDVCHAKILEARRTLDGITAQVLAMDDNIGHQRNIEVENTVALRVAMEDRSRAQAELAASQETCHQMEDKTIAKYADELEELRQIAMPTVRSMISTSGDYGDAAASVAADIKSQIANSDALKAQVAAELSEGSSSSFAQISWGPEQCRRFVSFLSKMTGLSKTMAQTHVEPSAGPTHVEPSAGPTHVEPSAGPTYVEPSAGPTHVEPSAGPTMEPSVGIFGFSSGDGNTQTSPKEFLELDCSEARFLLQHEFSAAYLELYGLHEAAVVRLDEEQKECLRRAHHVYDMKVGHLDDEIRKATARISKARAVVNGLLTRLEEASRAATKMEQHLQRLKTECEVSDEVSEHLLKVRKLIESLEACPGRNAFRLSIPTSADIEKNKLAI
jgi:hypothetical protein